MRHEVATMVLVVTEWQLSINSHCSMGCHRRFMALAHASGRRIAYGVRSWPVDPCSWRVFRSEAVPRRLPRTEGVESLLVLSRERWHRG